MIPGCIHSYLRSVREPHSRSRSAKVEKRLGPFWGLPDSPLTVILGYLPARDLQRLTSLYERVKHLAFHASSEGGEAVWTSLYRRDHAPSMALVGQLLPQQAKRFRDLSSPSSLHTPPSRGFRALGGQALATMERSSMWRATRADVLAQLYPALLSCPTYDCRQVLTGHTDSVCYVIQLADGSIASASQDFTIRIWPLGGGAPRVLTGHERGVTCIIQLADGRIASASYDGTIRIWPLGAGAPVVLGQIGTNEVLKITQLADSTIASWSIDFKVRFWALDGVEPRFIAGSTYPVRDFIELADRRIALLSAHDGMIRLFSIEEYEAQHLQGNNKRGCYITQLADGSIASTSEDGSVRIWPLGGGAPRVLKGHNDLVRSIIQLEDGSIASASWDGTIRIWSLNGNASRVLKGHNGPVHHLIQLVDGSIASASGDGTIRIWSLNGNASRVLKGHNGPVRRLIQLVDGSIASASGDGTIRIWGLNTNQLVRTATRQARYRKAMHKVSRKAVLALGFVLLAWGVNALLKTIVRGFTHTT